MRFKFLDYSVFNSKGRITIVDMDSNHYYFLPNKQVVEFIKKLRANLVTIIEEGEEEGYEGVFKIKKTGKYYGLEFVTQEDMNLIDPNFPE